MSRLDEPVASQTETQENQNEIRPEDSVSSAGSQKSKRSSRQSGTSSIKSSSSAKTRAAAKQAALKAKANALHKLHKLQLEELKIQQKKSQVELQAEIAAAEGEKIVYEQSEKELHSNPSCAVENSSPPCSPAGYPDDSLAYSTNVREPSKITTITHDRTNEATTDRTTVKSLCTPMGSKPAIPCSSQ